jgi:hypothetical protein
VTAFRSVDVDIATRTSSPLRKVHSSDRRLHHQLRPRRASQSSDSVWLLFLRPDEPWIVKVHAYDGFNPEHAPFGE